jgi:mannose-6-phosphate isomerase-like protein (cupin superfamily)
MNAAIERGLVLELKHTGERLVLHRVRGSSGIEELHLAGSLPPQREGPPLHVHTFEDEHGTVVSGTLSAVCDGQLLTVTAGNSASFPKGSAHRWWNAGQEDVVFRGVATPAVDLDRFLQALFAVLNAGEPGRPPFFYLAHVLYRHRKSQTALVMPPWLQKMVLPLAVGVGSLLGKYRGRDWPGCPARCEGAPSR